jgi:hypothetical protein
MEVKERLVKNTFYRNLFLGKHAIAQGSTGKNRGTLEKMKNMT